MPSSAFIDMLMPPASLAALALLLLLWRGRRVRLLLLVPLVPLVAMSMPIVSSSLIALLDPPELWEAGDGAMPQAIVILSADVERTRTGAMSGSGTAATARSGTDLGPWTLERERAGAALARRTGLPVLVSGGIVTAPPPVAVMMSHSMVQDFGIRVRWIEAGSLTTWENAQFSARMLKASGVDTVYVVTHAWHMRRSLLAFRRAGLVAVPSVVRTDPWPRGNLAELVPRVSAWTRSYLALHEWIGFVYYRMRS